MKVKVIQETRWNRALNAARRTIGKTPIDKEPSDNWKKMVIMAEHSPIKLVEYLISFSDLRQWVGVHLLRHEHTLPFIHSQREDRREDIDALVDKVLSCASKETREAWNAVKEAIAEFDPIMANAMVRNCVYRGRCPEMKYCGYYKTKAFKKELEDYWSLINR